MAANDPTTRREAAQPSPAVGEEVGQSRTRLSVDLARSGLTWRSILIGVVLIPPNVYWVTQMEMFRYSAHPTTVSLFFNAVFILLVIAGANLLVQKLRPAWALTQAEMLLIYSMMCISSCICGHDGIQVLMPMFSWSTWMATPENKWNQLINPHLPKWLTVQNMSVLRGFYEGGSTMYRPSVIAAWGPPMAAWGAFIVALVLIMLGINVLIRRQWLEGEHLACPLVTLPVEISLPKPRLFLRHMFWIGFAIAASIDIYNSFAFLYPVMPLIPISWQDLGVAAAAKGRPWSAIGWTPVTFYPFMIGIGYLMPTDFLFSCWFFYMFWKTELVGSAMFGWDQVHEFPFTNFQCFGAYMLFAVQAIYIGRPYLREVWKRIAGEPGARPERNETFSYRSAAIVAGVCLAFLVGFSAVAGMQVWLAILFFVIYFGLALAITRMRAQFGAPVHDLHFTGPGQILTSAIGTRNFPRQDLVIMALYWWFNRAYRNHPMPHQMEAMRMQEVAGASNRGMWQAMTISTVVAILAAFWISLHMYYVLGATAKGRMFSGDNFPQLQAWLQAPEGVNWMKIMAIGVGLIFGAFLQTMRMKFMWWPFHPLGFAISSNWEINLVWMPLLIAWVLKTLITKYGGHKAYTKAVPLFLGLILGQFVVGSVLNIVSIILHIPSYMFWQ